MISLFFIAAIVFALFTIGYCIGAAAVIYHLLAYTIEGYSSPKIALLMFFSASVILWLSALYFLFHIPSQPIILPPVLTSPSF